jgi:mRNA interferase HigB
MTGETSRNRVFGCWAGLPGHGNKELAVLFRKYFHIRETTCIFVSSKNSDMRIVTYRRIAEFCSVHKDAETALEDWYQKTENSEWKNFSEIKQTFGSVDFAGNDRYVFNIRGNNYRLVAIVIFASKKVYIRFIGTHSEYNKIDCSTV